MVSNKINHWIATETRIYSEDFLIRWIATEAQICSEDFFADSTKEICLNLNHNLSLNTIYSEDFLWIATEAQIYSEDFFADSTKTNLSQPQP